MAIDKEKIQKAAVRMAWQAAEQGDAAALSVALRGAPDPALAANSREQGVTLLIMATRNDFVAGLQALLEAGADATATDRLGQTPAHFAAYYGYENSIRALRGAGCLDALTERGKSPLATAVGRAQHDAARALIESGADWSVAPGQKSWLQVASEKLSEASDSGVARRWEKMVALFEALELGQSAKPASKGQKSGL